MTLSVAVALLILAPPTQPVPVKIVQNDQGFSLLRNGQPYEIKGIGMGNGPIELFVQYGGNSLRTWGAEQLESTLELAQKHGLTVLAGIWIQHSDAADYNDVTFVERQKQEALAVIRRYKDHPALLMWGIGNEAHGFGDRYNPKVYQAINDIVREGKKIDPNHPFITVNADLTRIEDLNRYCPDLDAVGMNSYGGAFSIVDRYRAAGGTKPIVMTEFGPLGQWEMPKNDWGANPEASSTEKAAWYRQAFNYFQSKKGDVLGSYAFLWGNKQEVTHTWYGMVSHSGAPLAAAQVAKEFWKGSKAPNLCPVVESLTIPKPVVKPGETVTATLKATDPEGRPLTVKWELREEQTVFFTGGRDETPPANVSDAIKQTSNERCTFVVPSKATGYRLFATIRDADGNEATANIVFLARND